MNLQRPNAGESTQTANRSRDVVPCSGICTICVDGCQGNCEIFKASFRGREVIYPGPFGEVTAGGNKDYPIDYSHLNIHGYALGAEAIEEANRHTYSRFPVLAPRDQQVVGIVSLFDLLGLDGGEKLGSVMHPPFFSKDGEQAEKLLLRMKEEALHMAIVEDVRGEKLGIITLENILESIVGDIQDEYD